MTSYVVDASVAMKWLLREAESSAAERLLGKQFELRAPDFLFVESANVLWKRSRSGDLSADKAIEGLSLLMSSPILIHPSRGLIASALAIAGQSGRTVYDSLYLALASQCDCKVVTADKRFFNAVQNGPFAALVILVAQVP